MARQVLPSRSRIRQFPCRSGTIGAFLRIAPRRPSRLCICGAQNLCAVVCHACDWDALREAISPGSSPNRLDSTSRLSGNQPRSLPRSWFVQAGPGLSVAPKGSRTRIGAAVPARAPAVDAVMSQATIAASPRRPGRAFASAPLSKVWSVMKHDLRWLPSRRLRWPLLLLQARPRAIAGSQPTDGMVISPA
jgi:hypothetical protein